LEPRVRLAAPHDLDALAALVARANATYVEWAGPCWKPPGVAHERLHWRERLNDAAAWNAVAESDGHLLGCVSFTHAHTVEDDQTTIPRLAHLSRMFVDPERWRRGIGSLLLTRAVEEMRSRGYERAQLFTPTANVRSRSFYERHAWRPEDGTRYWRGLLLVRYSLEIKSG
jgi:GNAT superfamily N-acetyltransferase